VRIGLLADIHDDGGRLSSALGQFSLQRTDQVLVLGDTLTCPIDPEKANVVVELLRNAQAIGVWGNHDFGFCVNVCQELRRQVSPSVLAFMATMRPHYEAGDCFFSHVDPWLDPWDVRQLWHYDGPPDTEEKAARSFAVVPHRFLFLGHFHDWLLMTTSGRSLWTGTEPVRLGAWKRCLVVVGAVFQGHCAVFDTESTELTPLKC
jgi:hypothetical protein